MPTLIASIYARKSTDQSGVADEAKSVTRQIEHARAYAERRGWLVADEHIYVDDGISGAEFANRPGFLRLMNALKPRAPFEALIVSELSRLGREQLETGYAVKQLSQAGVKIISYLEDREILLDTPTDKFLMSAVNFAAEIERERARQRTYDALERKARAGQVTGGRVFGFDNVRDPAGVRRVINSAEAAVVQRIFELAAAGSGLTSIAKRLNNERAPSPRAQQGRPAGWAPSSVREVLHRPLYRGEIIWNRSRKRDSWGVKHQAPRPAADWIHVAAPELAIIAPDLWDRTHRQMAAQRARYDQTSAHGAPPWGTEAKYLLTGLLRCGVCGSGIEARSRRSPAGGRFVFYGCAAYHRRGRSVCDNALTVPMDNADTAVLSSLESTLLNPRVLNAALERAVARLSSPTTDGAGIAAELRSLDQELARLTEAIAAGGGSIPALVTALHSREARRHELLAERHQHGARDAVDLRAIRADLERRLLDWRSLIQDRAAHGRPLVKQLIVGRLEMTPNQEERYYSFRGTGTLLPVLEGVVPQSVASPPGFEPGFQP